MVIGRDTTVKKRGNILHDVVIISIAVIVLIILLGSYIFSSFYNNVREDFLESQKVFVSGIERTHENEIQILKNIATQMNISSSGRFLLDRDPIKCSVLKDQLNQYRAVNQFFDVMYSYYQRDHYLFNHSTSLELDFFCQKAYAFENCNAENLRTLLTNEHRELTVIPEGTIGGEMYRFYSTGNLGLLYVLPIPPDFDSLLIFLVGSNMMDRLLQAESGENRNTYLVYQGTIMASRGNEEIDEGAVLQLLNESSLRQDYSINGQQYLLTQMTGDSGFTYLTLQNMKTFSQMMQSQLWGLLALLFLCCAPSGIIIYLISRRMIRQVSSISSILQQEGEERYELSQIETGIRNLVENTENLKEDMMPLQKNRFIRNFLRSDYTAIEALKRDAAAADIDVSLGHYMVGILGSHSEANEERAYEDILAFIREKEDIDGWGIHLLNTSQRVMVLFAKGEDELYAAFDNILSIGRKHCDAFVVAVSWHHTGLLKGSLAYIEATSAFDNRFLMDNDQVIRVTETSKAGDYERYKEQRELYMRKIEHTIRMGSRQEVEEAIHELCSNLRREHTSMFTFRLLADEVQRMLMAQWKGEEKQWNQIYNVFTLSRCISMDDFEQLLLEACHMLLDEKKDAANAQSSLVEQAIQAIRNKYSSADLNISGLADTLNVSPVTLAVEFKNETGISPSDYLAMIRMEEAKRLLSDTDLLVREICQRVGYEDDHVFIRRFKKYSGKTPGQFRREN